MTRSLVNAMDAVGRGAQVESLISPTGGHFLCGDGLYPHRAWQEDTHRPLRPISTLRDEQNMRPMKGKLPS